MAKQVLKTALPRLRQSALVGVLTPADAASALPFPEELAGKFSATGKLILYDGVCNLCNAGIRFVAKRDPDKNIMFCSVQSRAAEPYLRMLGMDRQQVLKRFVFIEYQEIHEGSTAALKVAKYLQPPWPLAQVFLAVPTPVRDMVYDAVAASRYHLWGRTRCCQVPDSSIIDRFVDRDELLLGVCSTEGYEEDRGSSQSSQSSQKGPLASQHSAWQHQQQQQGSSQGHHQGLPGATSGKGVSDWWQSPSTVAGLFAVVAVVVLAVTQRTP